jgi:DNA-binding NarL/FixJ family response regulator
MIMFIAIIGNRPPMWLLYQGPLTSREKDILRLMSRGLMNKEIAYELGIGEATVKNHITSIYLKLGAGNRTEAVLRALRQEVIPWPDKDEPIEVATSAT